MEAPEIPKDLSKVSDHRKKEYYKKQLGWTKKCIEKEKESLAEWRRTLQERKVYEGSLKFDALACMEALHRLEIIRKSISVTCRPIPDPEIVTPYARA